MEESCDFGEGGEMACEGNPGERELVAADDEVNDGSAFDGEY